MNMCELRIALIGRRMRSCAPTATICEYFSEKSFLFKTEFHIVDGCAAISLLARPFRITLHTYSTVWADGCGETSAETVAHRGSLVVVL